MRKSQNLSDVRLEACAVDCVFYILSFWGACECTWKYQAISSNRTSHSARNQGHDKRGEIWMFPITCGVFNKVMNGLVMTLEEDEIFMCLAALLCEQFFPFMNGGAKISINSYFMRSFCSQCN